MHGRRSNNAFLQINHDLGGDGIEFCQRLGFSLWLVDVAHRRFFSQAISWHVSLQSARSTLCLLPQSPARKTTSAELFPLRNFTDPKQNVSNHEIE